jgi:hypothetical protein
MIIDLILDRNEGVPYSDRKFYLDVIAHGLPGYDIACAMDGGTEDDVKRALCEYIDNFDYPPELKEYICSVEWICD